MPRYIFILPAVTRLTGGPGANAEYVKELRERNHLVDVYIPSSVWHGISEFKWTSAIYPKFNSRKNKVFSSVFAIKNLALLLTKQRNYNLVKDILIILLKAMWQQRNLGLKSNFFALRRVVATVLPYFDLPKIDKEDFVIATFWPTSFAAAISKSVKSVYLMQHYEEVFYPDDSEYSLLKVLVRATYDLPILQSSNSKWLSEVIQNKHEKTVQITCTNGIPNEFLDFKKKIAIESDPETKKIIAYARPEPWKGMATVLRTVIELRKKHNVELTFYGQVDDYWKRLSREFDFKFIENISYQELIEAISSHDIAICGSWYESFPLPPLEAMFCGVPVVCTQAGTEEYAIDQDTALIYEAGNFRQAAQQIEKLIENPNLGKRISERAIEKALQFTWEKAHEKRTSWLENLHHLEMPKYKKIRLRKNNSVIPFNLDVNETHPELIRDPFGHVFLKYAGVTRHLHQSSDVGKYSRMYKMKVKDVDFDIIIDKWRI